VPINNAMAQVAMNVLRVLFNTARNFETMVVLSGEWSLDHALR